MKQIEFNEDLLTLEDIDKVTNKVRGIVIKEESGIDIEKEKINPFLEIHSYDKNYYDRNSGVINRLTKTVFYTVETTKDIDESKKDLTESEKNKKHTISFVDLDSIESLVENNQTTNPKRKQFDREILTAIFEYKKLIKVKKKVIKLH